MSIYVYHSPSAGVESRVSLLLSRVLSFSERWPTVVCLLRIYLVCDAIHTYIPSEKYLCMKQDVDKWAVFCSKHGSISLFLMFVRNRNPTMSSSPFVCPLHGHNNYPPSTLVLFGVLNLEVENLCLQKSYHVQDFCQLSLLKLSMQRKCVFTLNVVCLKWRTCSWLLPVNPSFVPEVESNESNCCQGSVGFQPFTLFGVWVDSELCSYCFPC